MGARPYLQAFDCEANVGKPVRMKVENGPEKGQKFKITADALVIGSGPDVQIRIEAPGVAARHAQVLFDGGQVKLEDLGTKEGTFRNGQRLLGPVQLFPGDRVGLGPNVVLILQGDDPGGESASESSLADDMLDT